MRLIIPICFLLHAVFSYAQPSQNWMGKPKPYKWQLGLQGSAFDDDGRNFCQPFNAKVAWNILNYPSSLYFNKHIIKYHSWEAMLSLGKYSSSKLVNRTTGRTEMILAFDLYYKYSFGLKMQNPKIDPFITLGLGMTQRFNATNAYQLNTNLGFGMNYWVFPRWGICARTTGKFSVFPDILGDGSYTQHQVGLVYRSLPKSALVKNAYKPRHKWIKKQQRKKYKTKQKKVK